MPNITMTLDENLVPKVQKVAAERRTTITALVRQHLQTIAAREDANRRQAAIRLRASFDELCCDMGPQTGKLKVSEVDVWDRTDTVSSKTEAD